MKRRLGHFGSRFAFEFYLEVMHDEIIKGLRKHLTSLQSENLRQMIKEDRFLPLESLDFPAATESAEHLERLTPLRLMEFLAEARPDLAQTLQDCGPEGAQYVVKWRRHLLDLVRHPEKALGKSIDYKPEAEVALATCDQCGKSWPIPKGSSVDKCPFCGL